MRLLGLSLAGVVAVPAVWMSTRQPANEGSVRALSQPPASTAPPRDGDPTPLGVPLPAIEVHSARLADLKAPDPDPAPVSVRIDGVGVDARIVPVGVDLPKGITEVPANVGTIGWYRFGPSPGAPGSALLIGHVDSRTQGAGAFFRLSQVHPGQVVVIHFADGSRRSFEVIARRSYPKTRLPSGIFSRDGPPSLALVTCGGSFDRGTRSYSDNVVVFAVPLT